jgi:rhodanese-related sulfurtransferase
MRRALLIAAIVAGGLAPFAGSPDRTAAQLDVQRLAAAVEREEDHVTAVELARWIHDRKPGLRVVDVRSAAEFEAYHVPSAENVPLHALVAATIPKGDTLVLISDGGAHAAQAWVFLQALGYPNVYFLRGGLQEWLDDVMSPASATPDLAELSRYFGGSPRPGGGQEPPPVPSSLIPSSRDRVASMRRRGC